MMSDRKEKDMYEKLFAFVFYVSMLHLLPVTERPPKLSARKSVGAPAHSLASAAQQPISCFRAKKKRGTPAVQPFMHALRDCRQDHLSNRRENSKTSQISTE